MNLWIWFITGVAGAVFGWILFDAARDVWRNDGHTEGEQ